MILPEYTPQQVVDDLRAQARYCRERGQVGNAIAWEVRAAQIEAMTEALNWYADPISYVPTQMAEPRSAVHGDQGKRAKAALKQ